MPELLELTTLSVPILLVGKARDAAVDWMVDARAKGKVIGCWGSEIGTLGRLYILRSFLNSEEVSAERDRTLLSASPFNAGSIATAIEMDDYRQFPFLPPPRLDPASKIFEFRTYHLKVGGLPPTLAGWEAAIEPAREYTDHLITNMYAVSGPPRITHIWGFSDMEERFALRSKVYKAGLWPPVGGPENLSVATSTIAILMNRQTDL